MLFLIVWSLPYSKHHTWPMRPGAGPGRAVRVLPNPETAHPSGLKKPSRSLALSNSCDGATIRPSHSHSFLSRIISPDPLGACQAGLLVCFALSDNAFRFCAATARFGFCFDRGQK